MSKENAKKYLETHSKDGLNNLRKMDQAEIEALIKKEGLDFSVEELEEAVRGSILSQDISDEELDMASGGGSCDTAQGHMGGCTTCYYDRECEATVEGGSWCGTNDACCWTYECYNCNSLSESPYGSKA